MGDRDRVKESIFGKRGSAARRVLLGLLASTLFSTAQVPLPVLADPTCPTVIDGNFYPSPPSAGDDLTSCDLTGALLVGVNLANTNFTGATLTNVDFTGATLTNANFTNASLTGANLTGA